MALLTENSIDLQNALVSDFRSVYESQAEVDQIISEIVYVLDRLDSWAGGERPSVGLAFKMDGCAIRPIPYGVTLIIGPWNYPLSTLLQPFVGAVAAGNVVVLKISEMVPETSKCLMALWPK